MHDGSGYCVKHSHLKSNFSNRANPKRITGRKLQELRAQLFRREPLCRECNKHGLITIATIRDHIIPLAEGGQDVDENIQPLCKTCSDAKTGKESARGRGRQMSGASQL